MSCESRRKTCVPKNPPFLLSLVDTGLGEAEMFSELLLEAMGVPECAGGEEDMARGAAEFPTDGDGARPEMAMGVDSACVEPFA